MQTPAERCLIAKIVNVLNELGGRQVTMLNVGAGRSTVIEHSVARQAQNFVCDRVDVMNQHVNHPNVRHEYVSMVEHMPVIASHAYDLAFANYVLEHVSDIQDAAHEIHRVLKRDGRFIATVPNPRAPEFLVARMTPLWFHQLIRGQGKGSEAFETYYAYRSIHALNHVFKQSGFLLVDLKRYAFIHGYLHKFPILRTVSRAYDAVVNALRLTPLMGHVCVSYKKLSTRNRAE